MRRYTFRGKIHGKWRVVTPDDKKWVYFWTHVDRSTVGQCVDVQDANHANIYEGDIVTAYALYDGSDTRYHEARGVVTYRDDGYCLVQSDSDETPYLSNYRSECIEIVGNVHDAMQERVRQAE